jgi:O-ureido-D-serine cyclo-ligase
LRAAGASVDIACWDDAQVDWARFAAALIRSTWDYTWRLDDYLRWIDHAATCTRLFNPPALLRWNSDKRYLAEMAQAGIAIVPTHFVATDAAIEPALDAARAAWPHAELVIKPSVSAGSRDTMRHSSDAHVAMRAHLAAIQAQSKHALIQPYLARVDSAGETALLFFDGVFSHAIRKGPLLSPNTAATRALFAPEHIQPRQPAADELALAQHVLATLPAPFNSMPGAPLYARVDLLRDDAGAPCLIELELVEPSLFLDFAPGAAQRLASALLARISA